VSLSVGKYDLRIRRRLHHQGPRLISVEPWDGCSVVLPVIEGQWSLCVRKVFVERCSFAILSWGGKGYTKWKCKPARITDIGVKKNPTQFFFIFVTLESESGAYRVRSKSKGPRFLRKQYIPTATFGCIWHCSLENEQKKKFSITSQTTKPRPTYQLPTDCHRRGIWRMMKIRSLRQSRSPNLNPCN